MFLEAGGKKVAPFPGTLTGTPKELGGQDSSQFYCQKPQLGRGGGAEATGVKEGTPLARRPLVLGAPGRVPRRPHARVRPLGCSHSTCTALTADSEVLPTQVI